MASFTISGEPGEFCCHGESSHYSRSLQSNKGRWQGHGWADAAQGGGGGSVSLMTILDALKGIGGTYEVQRILGAFGTVIYAVTAPALVWAGKVNVSFDTFCISYPIGLGACIGATAGAIALKDRSVARAKVTERTGE